MYTPMSAAVLISTAVGLTTLYSWGEIGWRSQPTTTAVIIDVTRGGGKKHDAGIRIALIWMMKLNILPTVEETRPLINRTTCRTRLRKIPLNAAFGGEKHATYSGLIHPKKCNHAQQAFLRSMKPKKSDSWHRCDYLKHLVIIIVGAGASPTDNYMCSATCRH